MIGASDPRRPNPDFGALKLYIVKTANALRRLFGESAASIPVRAEQYPAESIVEIGKRKARVQVDALNRVRIDVRATPGELVLGFLPFYCFRGEIDLGSGNKVLRGRYLLKPFARFFLLCWFSIVTAVTLSAIVAFVARWLGIWTRSGDPLLHLVMVVFGIGILALGLLFVRLLTWINRASRDDLEDAVNAFAQS